METKKQIRQMPYSIETEQAVLGSMLISDNAASYVCSSFSIDAFYSLSHKKIYEKMLEIYRKNRPIDYVTLVSELEKAGELEEVGGVEYLTTLTNIVPTAANYTHYCEILKRDLVLRELITAGEKIVQMAYESDDMVSALKFAEKEIFEIGDKQSFSNLEQISDSVKQVLDKFEVISRDKDAMKGLKTGLYALDKLTNGLQKGDLILLAARPGVGKTSLAMNIVNNAALQSNAKVAIFSLEMPKVQLAQRSLCSHAFVSMEKALKGELSSEDWAALWQANKDFSEAGIYVDDSSLNTPMDILSKCRKLKREKGLDLVMIDYLQLMSGTSKSTDNRQQEISEMTRSLKIAAKELNVPILLLSQLSRAVEARTDHRPMLSDLRESGAIEQDADIVMFIYNPDNYVQDENLKQGIVDLIVAKHRNGPIDTLKLKFIREHTTFTNLNKDSEAESLEKSMPAERKITIDKDSLPDIVPIGDSDISDIF
ncbi:MAG: replicative DNA helicase [Clostridiales bacterium]|nr:replicative DNA helicase [Candidatus Apopatousia equi]